MKCLICDLKDDHRTDECPFDPMDHGDLDFQPLDFADPYTGNSDGDLLEDAELDDLIEADAKWAACEAMDYL